MVGIESYFSIRRRVSNAGLSVFEDTNENNKLLDEKVHFLATCSFPLVETFLLCSKSEFSLTCECEKDYQGNNNLKSSKL